MMNCPTLPVASRNLGHPEEVRQNPKLSGIWAALIKDVPKWSPGSPPKRGNLLMLPPTDKAPLPSTGTNSNSQEDHFMVDSDIAFKKPGTGK